MKEIIKKRFTYILNRRWYPKLSQLHIECILACIFFLDSSLSWTYCIGPYAYTVETHLTTTSIKRPPHLKDTFWTERNISLYFMFDFASLIRPVPTIRFPTVLGSPLRRETGEMAQKITVLENMGNLEILLKHREFWVLNL